ncbi:hypothetical protein BC628DRAFT_1350647 [Trametes gibbosa]|nr:hypothetical protein BC628DRAFT_1350647 [Trametes gibbosa]
MTLTHSPTAATHPSQFSLHFHFLSHGPSVSLLVYLYGCCFLLLHCYLCSIYVYIHTLPSRSDLSQVVYAFYALPLKLSFTFKVVAASLDFTLSPLLSFFCVLCFFEGVVGVFVCFHVLLAAHLP